MLIRIIKWLHEVVQEEQQHLKQTEERLHRSHEYYANLKKKHKICIGCDKKGVQYDKTVQGWFCAKDLKQTIELNKSLAPVMAALAAGEEEES
jgi:hypothetical protein